MTQTNKDILLGLADPATATALHAGADALDALAAVTAERDTLLTKQTADTAEIQRLNALVADLQSKVNPQPQPAAVRFPGDPGPNKVITGAACGYDDRIMLAKLESSTGSKLAFRQYRGGSADFAVPNGALCQQIKIDHAAGRIPVISPKPGIENLAAHKFGPDLEAFFKWTEAQPKITAVIIHHEPENDWKADFGNAAAYAKHTADYRAAQQWVRACLNKSAGGKPKKTIFMGSLLSYSWTAQGKSKFGDPNAWNPGKQADGTHVWDMVGADHYAEPMTATTLDTQQWKDFVTSTKAWGCLPAVTENGVRGGNPNGGKVLADFLAKYGTSLGMYLYFSSNAGAGGQAQPDVNNWWTLIPGNGSLPAYTDFVKAHGSNPNA